MVCLPVTEKYIEDWNLGWHETLLVLCENKMSVGVGFEELQTENWLTWTGLSAISSDWDILQTSACIVFVSTRMDSVACIGSTRPSCSFDVNGGLGRVMMASKCVKTMDA